MTNAFELDNLIAELEQARLAHLGTLLEALRQLRDSPRVYVPLARSLEKTDCHSGVSLSQAGKLKFMVEEGPFFYELARRDAGWGSIITGCRLGRVVIVLVDAVATGVRVIAEAEIRLDPARPARNAEQLGRAAAALVHQGALSRPLPSLGRAISTSHLPEVGLGPRAVRYARRARQALGSILWPSRLQWSIGSLPASAVRLDTGVQFPWSDVRWLDPPSGGFIADPFLVAEGSRSWLFYEQLSFTENRGTLWVAAFDCRTGAISGETEVLCTSHHLSFPNVFFHGDRWFMLPEHARSGATSLYRATRFPFTWEKHRDLLPAFPGIDPVLHWQDGRWWLFVTHGMQPCNENNLFLFSAPTLDDDFVAHPMNPIASGLHGSRMAGRLLQRDGRLYRPAQDGRSGYGQGLVMFEVLALNESTYRERCVVTWSPSSRYKYGCGFHSYSENDEIAVVDGQTRIKRQRHRTAELLRLVGNRLVGRL